MSGTASANDAAHMRPMPVIIVRPGRPPSDHIPKTYNSISKILMRKTTGIQHRNADAAPGKPACIIPMNP
jgi:hypothetical protein